MQEHMVRIELGGILGKKFGKSHCRMVATASEAIRALCCTINGFEKFMNNSKAMGLTYAVFKGKKNISEDDIPFPINDKVIRIVPVVIGSKKAGVLQTILGVALIAVASIATMGTGGIFAAIAAGSGWGSAAMLGASMVLGGVLQMLSPQVPGLASQNLLKIKPPTHLAGSRTPPLRDIRYRCYTASGLSAGQLFQREFM